jgi:hypothetical protein
MRKLIIFICVLLAGGALYALVPNLFPDTPSFPRTPTAEGTVGWVLEKIVGGIISDATDGTVANTAKLDWVTATGYLKNNSCNIPDKWIGIDANGKAVCGTSNPILADYGTISEQGCTATVYHADGTFTNASNTGDTLKSGDIVKTQNIPNCTLTIAFADFSILRLDADTTVSLDVLAAPAPSTQTIASAILSNGSLWGRILTDTGSYSIGTDKIVAWVRGTSVAVVSTGNTIGTLTYTATGWQIPLTPSIYNTELAIVDSVNTSPTNPAATVYCRGTNGTATPLNSINPENQYSIATSGAWCLPSTPPRALTSTAATLYARSPWIRRNTQKDVSYMYRLLALSGSSIPDRISKINIELTNSQPPDNPGDLEAGNICEPNEKWWTPRYGCQPKVLYAIADYTLPIIPGASSAPTGLSISGMSVPLPNNSSLKAITAPLASIVGVSITNTTDYISYNLITPQYIGLIGKTITIKYSGTPNDGNNIVFLWWAKSASWDSVQSQWFCSPWLTCTTLPGSVSILVGSTSPPPNQFIIWNNSSFTDPIWVVITSIIIK